MFSRARVPVSLSKLPGGGRKPTKPGSGGTAAVPPTLSWISNGSDSYDVGWDNITHSSGSRNDPTLYPNRESVGTSTSWTNLEGVTVYAAVRSVRDGEIGPWSAETTL